MLISQILLDQFWQGLLHIKGYFSIKILGIGKYHDYIICKKKKYFASFSHSRNSRKFLARKNFLFYNNFLPYSF
jgi:hypothetical protein